jgi:hypothetical protein
MSSMMDQPTNNGQNKGGNDDIKSSLNSSRSAMGKRLSFLPNVILTSIWHFFNLKGISLSAS